MLEFYNKKRQVCSIPIQGGRFLIGGWRKDFEDCKTRLLRVLRLLKDDDVSDDNLKSVVREVGEVQRQLRETAAILDGFDQFCRSSTSRELMQIFYGGMQIPKPPGPVDRMPIDKLSVS
jgi:hypothetical protein